MMLQVIDGVVGSAHNLHAKLLQNGLRGQAIGQLGIGALPDRSSRFLVQQFGDAEVALQFEMRPMVERIAQGVRNSSRPRQKFFIRSRIAGNIALRDAVGPHRPPFVMIALQPDLKKIGKPSVLRNVAYRKMTVIVEDGLRRGELAIEAARHVIRKEKVFGEKSSHDQCLRAHPQESIERVKPGNHISSAQWISLAFNPKASSRAPRFH